MNVLIYCGANNSCLSQIAEGYFKFFVNRKVNIYSAGANAEGVDPKAIETMAEVGIDLRGHTSNTLSEYAHVNFDYVITVTGYDENTPAFSDNVRHFCYSFPKPETNGTEEEFNRALRNVRDEIKVFAQNFVETHFPY